VECRAATPGQPTRPNLTGSSPTPKTIGIAEVASFAARAASGKPGVTMTATRRRTKSAVSIGSVSYRPSTQWYSTVPRAMAKYPAICLCCGRRGLGGYPRDGFLSLFHGLGYVGHQLFQIVLGCLKPRRPCVHFHLPIRRPPQGKGSPAVFRADCTSGLAQSGTCRCGDESQWRDCQT